MNRFNGCAYDDTGGATQWISVCDPTPPDIQLPRSRETKVQADGRSILPATAVHELARRGLEEYRVHESERGRAALAEGNFGQPRLVHRLDRPGDFYYLTPWEREGGILGTVEIDARFGFFKSVRIMAEPAKDWIVGASSRRPVQAITRLVDGKRFDLPGEAGRFRVYPGTYCVPSALVWKPCRESWSPHLPFYQLAIGGHLLYVRIDGKVFTHLTSGRGV
jgi:hypothetical protein